MSLYIGTSGWAYKEWKPDFYPDGLPQSRFLEHYSSVLGACEINATFYRMQEHETVAKWAASAGPDFRFSIKAHRGLTHGRAVGPDDAKLQQLKEFLRSLEPLGDRLGVVLFQYPPHRKRDDEGLARLLDALPHDLRYAFEFRDPSWDAPEIAEIIGDRGTICLSNTDGSVPDRLPDGPLAYVRLRTDRYTHDARDEWLALLRSEATSRTVFAFTKHEGIPTDDRYGGIGLARWLAARVPSPAATA